MIPNKINEFNVEVLHLTEQYINIMDNSTSAYLKYGNGELWIPFFHFNKNGKIIPHRDIKSGKQKSFPAKDEWIRPILMDVYFASKNDKDKNLYLYIITNEKDNSIGICSSEHPLSPELAA